MKSRFLSIALATTLCLVACAAAAGGAAPYTDAAFKQLTSAGKDVVIDVHADWCPTCRAQQPVLKQLVAGDKYGAYSILVVDFDAQTAARRQFRVSQQSTLIVFHGTDEKARATGITEASDIAALLDKGL